MNREMEDLRQALLTALYENYSLYEYHKLSEIVTKVFDSVVERK